MLCILIEKAGVWDEPSIPIIKKMDLLQCLVNSTLVYTANTRLRGYVIRAIQNGHQETALKFHSNTVFW